MNIDRRSVAKTSRALKAPPKARSEQPHARPSGDGDGAFRRRAGGTVKQRPAAPEAKHSGRKGHGNGDGQAPNDRRAPEAHDHPTHPQRTCVGCGKGDAPENLVRLVVSPEGEIAVDLAAGHFGRGAHIHPRASCVSGASKGLSRSMRRQVVVQPSQLAQLIADAAERRIGGLLSSAVRSRRAVAGADSVAQSLASGEAMLVVVARDAAAAASVGAIAQAVADGRAVPFGTKSSLGALFGRSEVGVLAITFNPLATAIRTTAGIAGGMQPVRPDADKRAAQASHNATTAEDR